MKKQNELKELKSELKLNRSKLFKRAYHYFVKVMNYEWSEALEATWKEVNEYRAELRTEIQYLTQEIADLYTPRISSEMESENANNLLLACVNSGIKI